MSMPLVLTRFRYRRVLIYNTVIIGVILVLFASIGPGTPAWLIVPQAFCFGFFSSLQYTSMNTLVYADVAESDTSMASTIASTVQQMSISFGVATASLVAALFRSIQLRRRTDDPRRAPGFHRPRRAHLSFHDRFPRIENQRWRQPQPAQHHRPAGPAGSRGNARGPNTPDRERSNCEPRVSLNLNDLWISLRVSYL